MKKKEKSSNLTHTIADSMGKSLRRPLERKINIDRLFCSTIHEKIKNPMEVEMQMDVLRLPTVGEKIWSIMDDITTEIRMYQMKMNNIFNQHPDNTLHYEN